MAALLCRLSPRWPLMSLFGGVVAGNYLLGWEK